MAENTENIAESVETTGGDSVEAVNGTPSLNLNKFDLTDTPKVSLFNANWDKIDGAFVLKNGEVKAAKAVDAETLGGKAESALSVASAATATKAAQATIVETNIAAGQQGNWFHNSRGEIIKLYTPGSSSAYPAGPINFRADGGAFISNTSGGYAPLLCSQVISNGGGTSSSIVNKTNVTDYTGALDKIAELNVYEYDRTDNGEHQIGLIVEDANTPEELIIRPEFGEGEEFDDIPKPVPAIATYSLLCMFIQAFKEQKEINDRLQTEIQLALTELAALIAEGQ